MKKEVFTKHRVKSIGVVLLFAVIIGLVGIALFITYAFFSSPNVIRNPYLQHYHFRMQIIADGQAQNFGDASYQTPESNVSCDVALPEAPIHFHDHKDQIVHVHWDGMTGGLLLKDYGWNYIGGISGTLGYRFDHLPEIKRVPIHGQVLPTLASGDKFYIYTGDASSYHQRSFDDFINQDFEKFFGKNSLLPASKPSTGLLNKLFPTAYAHSAETGVDLTRLNNLIGNVVIFAQKNKPSTAQVQDRFNHLEPLSDSVCGS